MTAEWLLTLLVVPPCNLAVLAAVGLAGWRRRGGRWLAGLALAALLLLSLPAVAERLLVSLETGLPAATPGAAPPAAIVLLGGDLLADVATPLGAIPGPLSLQRVREAAALARRTGLPVLASGGIVLRGAAPVAAVMAHSLRDDFGTPARWVEARSATTWANAADSAAMLDPLGIRSVEVVTSAWHMRRALIAFARTDLSVTLAPVHRDVAPPWRLEAFLPHASAWMTSYDALHEWIGCAWYRLRAWRTHG